MSAPLERLLEGVLARPGVVGALVTTLDGLVMSAVAVAGEDAEAVGAVGSMLARTLREKGEQAGQLIVRGGQVCVAVGGTLAVVALVEDGFDSEPVLSALAVVVEAAEGWIRPTEG